MVGTAIVTPSYGHPLSTIPTCCSHTHRPTTTSTFVPSARTMRTTRPTGLLGVPPLVAASGVGYGEGFAGNTHNFAPTGMMAAPFNAAARGDVEMILYLVAKGADPKAVNREGKTTADMANGPVQRIQPWPEALALLEKLGAVNNHRCVSC